MRRTLSSLLEKNRTPARVLRITDSLPLKEALELVNIRVLDHLIVAGGQVVSFAELGLL
jgi:DNA repair protein RadC